MHKADYTVVQNKPIADRIYEMTVEHELVSEMFSPGQFVHIKCGTSTDPLLRRPISICDVDPNQKQMRIIYRVEGKGTSRLSHTVRGDTVDILGPLGNGFPLDVCQAGDNALLVGGGVGVPPLYYLSRCLVEQGIKVTHILGFQSKKDVFLADAFRNLGQTTITTIDGTLGEQGLVTDVIDRTATSSWAAMYSCGPNPMLKALTERFSNHPQAYMSLEQRMGCGIGACFACVYHTPDSNTAYRKVCSDGPVFQVGEVLL